ncbi:trypsin-like peptidase domain-containing protein [Planctomicrobium sp. SH661]|uniref:trypsin-like peptidase domain-containing protein n=1 Tax=Planctomicrobium sp. SH661 TaxID=3448124 RepID=UPI003F5B4213
MTKQCCHAGMCLAMLLVFAPRLILADQPTLAPNSQRNTDRTRIVERAERSSVNIHTEKRQKSMDVVFSAGKATKINGMGTGIILDERGYIVTNFHVVQDVERLRVTTYNGGEYESRVLAYDSREDLAIIKIDPREKLEVANFGTSSDLMLGEDVIAIGNAYGYESSVTRGIISHRSRDVEVNEEQSYTNLIQIDAAINPGNSGGPLLNADGEVIGINVAIRAGAQRIGFAIPIDSARKVIARLMNVERHNLTYHGVSTTDVKHGLERKLVVESIRADSPANGSLKVGDVIVQAGDVRVVDGADFERSLFGRPAGTEVPIKLLRDGESQEVRLRIAELSSNRRQAGQQVVSNSGTVEAKKVSMTTSTPSTADKCWDVLGMKLEKVEGGFPVPNQPYRGGMRVTGVRSGGPAEVNGIREGDVLVGLHIWETVSNENIDYVLAHPQLQTMGPLKFYIVREGETLFGHFRLSAVAQR